MLLRHNVKQENREKEQQRQLVYAPSVTFLNMV